jgi:hypothetical protein
MTPTDAARFDEAWASQIGPALSERDTARLLELPLSEVATMALLRVQNRDGHWVYPLAQFDGARIATGLAEVLVAFEAAVCSPLTVTAWLTAQRQEFAGRSYADLLRDGAADRVATAARRAAATLRH